MSIPIFVVDAFTIDNNKPFTGNPAAVCLLEYDDDISDEVKQEIASQFNLSETAFVSYGWKNGEKLLTVPGADIERRTLRWFTRTVEVPLCGHATVASAKALHTAQFGGKGDKTFSFESKFRGKLGASISDKDRLITLNFPSNPTHSLNASEYPWMSQMIENGIGNDLSMVPAEAIQDIQYSPGSKILVFRLKDELQEIGLAKVNPNFKELLNIDTGDFINDIIVTVKGPGVEGKPDFYSRFFGPWDGIDEDPVTGLAHTVLTPYWTRELAKERSQVGTLWARQHSKRGGDLKCTLIGDRVQLSGCARVVIKGDISV